MLCEALMMLPKGYWNLKSLHSVRLYGCSKLSENLEIIKITNPNVEVVTMSTTSAEILFEKYWQEDDYFPKYSEFWNEEFYLFLQEIYRYF